MTAAPMHTEQQISCCDFPDTSNPSCTPHAQNKAVTSCEWGSQARVRLWPMQWIP